MPRLSIIVPVMGNPAQMEDSLVSLLENRPADCEILVVLNQPYADPYDLKEEVCFIEAPRGSRLVDSINLGIAVSHSPIIHLVSCGVEVCEGWCEAGLAALAESDVAAVAAVVVDRSNPARVLSAGVRYDRWGKVRRRAAHSGSAQASQTGLVDPDLPVAFYRRSALDRVGRLSSKVGDRLACVDLALALEHAGFRCVVEPRCRVLARRCHYVPQGGFQRGWSAERLFWRWLPRQGRWRALPLHLILVLLECIWSFPRPSMLTQLFGRLVAGLQFSAHRSHWQSLGQLGRSSPGAPSVLEGPHFLQHAARDRTREKSSIGG